MLIVSFAALDRDVLGHLPPSCTSVRNGGPAGNKATMYEQAGFPLADVMERAVFGLLFGTLAVEEYTADEDSLDLDMRGGSGGPRP
jgi:hypothetical protein